MAIKETRICDTVIFRSKERLWLQTILKELQICKPFQVKIRCDNISFIYLARNLKHSEKIKHFSLKYHFIRELTKENKITLELMPTGHMWADFLTKALSINKFKVCCKNLGLQKLINTFILSTPRVATPPPRVFAYRERERERGDSEQREGTNSKT